MQDLDGGTGVRGVEHPTATGADRDVVDGSDSPRSSEEQQVAGLQSSERKRGTGSLLISGVSGNRHSNRA